MPPAGGRGCDAAASFHATDTCRELPCASSFVQRPGCSRCRHGQRPGSALGTHGGRGKNRGDTPQTLAPGAVRQAQGGARGGCRDCHPLGARGSPPAAPTQHPGRRRPGGGGLRPQGAGSPGFLLLLFLPPARQLGLLGPASRPACTSSLQPPRTGPVRTPRGVLAPPSKVRRAARRHPRQRCSVSWAAGPPRHHLGVPTRQRRPASPRFSDRAQEPCGVAASRHQPGAKPRQWCRRL